MDYAGTSSNSIFERGHRCGALSVTSIDDHGFHRMEDPRFSIVDVEEEAGSQSTIREQSLAPKQAAAFVSIMQGCNMHCTFCIVPHTRGHERSRPIAEIVEEVRALVTKGVKEVTLLGQIVNLYGRHEFAAIQGKSAFVQLLEALQEIEGLERIRFTSPHPIGFRADLIGAFGRLSKLVEHIHLPLQSGSNRILKAMHRGYTTERYLELVSKLRRVRPEIGLSTDLIVGFPGETEEDFAQTLALAREVQFDQAYIFKYSPRRDTPAAAMPEQVPETVREERHERLLRLVNEVAAKRYEALVGRTVEIMVEGPSKRNTERLTGRTRCNKIVVFEGAERHRSQVMSVRVVRTGSFTLYGDPAVINLDK